MAHDPIAKSGIVGGLSVRCVPFYARGVGMALAAEALDIAGPALAKLAGKLSPEQLQGAAASLPMGQLMLALAAEGGVLCSNSTFCWWAAFLSELGRRARLAIFPDQWTARHSLSGRMGEGDCGAALRTDFMTLLEPPYN